MEDLIIPIPNMKTKCLELCSNLSLLKEGLVLQSSSDLQTSEQWGLERDLELLQGAEYVD